MTLPESSWVRYINRLSAINKTAARKFEAYLNTHDVMSKSGRKAALDYAAALVLKYGEGAAAVSCEMYDAVAAASGVILPAAEPASVASYGEVAKTINGIMKTSQNASYIASGVERIVKQAGADTTLMNARRDGAEFAWVPHGDTCSFCLMLASNGWRQASKKTIKGDHAEHIHANCDCTFAIRFDGKSNVEGYDPDKLREMYDNAEGDTWQEKLNSMRRDDYAYNGDVIRAQKREAYARHRKIKYGDINDFHTDRGTVTARRVDRYGYNNLLVDEKVNLTERQLRNVNSQISEAKRLLGITNNCDVRVIVTDINDKLASYNPRTNVLLINTEMTADDKIRNLQKGFACADDPRSTMVHELLHWKDAEAYRRAGHTILASDYKSEYVQYRCEIGKAKLIEAGIDIDSIDEIMNISEYSVEKWFDNDYDEVYTEFRTKQLIEG